MPVISQFMLQSNSLRVDQLGIPVPGGREVALFLISGAPFWGRIVQ